MKKIPPPSVRRLCKIYSLLDEIEKTGDISISSKEIGRRIGVPSHSIRKDISYLKKGGGIGAGYDIKELKNHINSAFGFDVVRNACIVGIGKLGTTLLNYKDLLTQNFKIVAGFDSSINRLETVKTDIPLYPTYELPEIIKREKIELAVLTVPGRSAKKMADNLINYGIKGIVNFSPIVLSNRVKDVFITNFDIAGEFRFLSAMFAANTSIKNHNDL